MYSCEIAATICNLGGPRVSYIIRVYVHVGIVSFRLRQSKGWDVC